MAKVSLQGGKNKEDGEIDLHNKVGKLISKHLSKQAAQFKLQAINFLSTFISWN